MQEMIKMVVVLLVLSLGSGGLLAALESGTQERIESQELEFVKGPAVRQILKGCSNDPISSRFKLKDGDVERSFFVGVYDGKPKTVVFEVAGKGFADAFGLMVGVDVPDDKLQGIGVTTHKETPGLGAKAKDDPGFAAQFRGMTITEPVKVTKDGGKVNAIGGATITSRAVSAAASDVGEIYKRLKPQIVEQANSFAK